VIATVPFNYPGGGRKVYPGFLQLAGFLSMNIESHMMSHYEMFKHLTLGDQEAPTRPSGSTTSTSRSAT
jgi:poly(3-hydroxybutyrate) depolymerase